MTTEQIEERSLFEKTDHVFQSNARILVVDDQDNIRLLYARILEKQGYSKIKSVADGIDAVKEFEIDPKAADVVIMDNRMRVMMGTEAARRIKSLNPKVKMIMVSGYRDLSEQDRALFEFVLEKPISMKELLLAINRVFV
jgi:CheY-like chemotaxis protein